jgi:hypothetical protein
MQLLVVDISSRVFEALFGFECGRHNVRDSPGIMVECGFVGRAGNPLSDLVDGGGHLGTSPLHSRAMHPR